jgi:hypothetical protein
LSIDHFVRDCGLCDTDDDRVADVDRCAGYDADRARRDTYRDRCADGGADRDTEP